MKKTFFFFFLVLTQVAFGQQIKSLKNGQSITLAKSVLLDKIKGGWAGQTIGVTYGGPYEFRFLGSMIQDYQKLQWANGQFKQSYSKDPGLYDDIYMDLSFVDVIDKYGVDAPVDSFASVFAHASYPLWHANQAGRNNILNGMKAPASGYWKNNPHADDIDFQIEADFAGLMYPGMSVAASKLCDKVGHIMNYGDGYYGGLFIASLYTQAFVSNDIDWIVSSALEAIPKQSNYYKCISDVIKWHHLYPNDWKQCWFEVQKKWTNDIACSDGVFKSYDISANLNSAYVIMGLLYGRGDFEKTMEIAIRCGQDADCNPASAAGILGTILGYNKIPSKWINALKEVEAEDFSYTKISLNKMYGIGYKHAIEMVQKNGGHVNDNSITLIYQQPVAVKFEKSFENIVPTSRNWIGTNEFASKNKYSFNFNGSGINITASLQNEWAADTKMVFQIEVNIDGNKEIVSMPYNFKTRKLELYYNYQLKKGDHHVELILLNPSTVSSVNLFDFIVYDQVSY